MFLLINSIPPPFDISCSSSSVLFLCSFLRSLGFYFQDCLFVPERISKGDGIARLISARLTDGDVGWRMAGGANGWTDFRPNAFVLPYLRPFVALILPVGLLLFLGPHYYCLMSFIYIYIFSLL
jgi:hypothetical protein